MRFTRGRGLARGREEAGGMMRRGGPDSSGEAVWRGRRRYPRLTEERKSSHWALGFGVMFRGGVYRFGSPWGLGFCSVRLRLRWSDGNALHTLLSTCLVSRCHCDI